MMVICIVVGALSVLKLRGAGVDHIYASGEITMPSQVSTTSDQSPSAKPDDASDQSQSAAIIDKRIAITFDDGPHGPTTARLLDGLKERNVHAAFFLIGEEIEGNEELVKRMQAEGHLIGNHTWSHVQLTTKSDAEASEELRATSSAIAAITGAEPEFMRPPFGTISKKVEDETNMIPILWSVDSLDWTTGNVDEIVNRVVTQAEDGAIILLHDCYESSVDAALRIIDLLQAEGYTFVTADELITN
jgi:peptidoglycan/xylan/chitin deacetylase (PgdA/CDA1 family)